MLAAHGRTIAPDLPVRWATHRRLEREIRSLRAAGIEVVRFEPCSQRVLVPGQVIHVIAFCPICRPIHPPV